MAQLHPLRRRHHHRCFTREIKTLANTIIGRTLFLQAVTCRVLSASDPKYARFRQPPSVYRRVIV